MAASSAGAHSVRRGGHTRAKIDPRDKDNPLQVDYLFASDGLIASDHAPIIATIEADSPGSEG